MRKNIIRNWGFIGLISFSSGVVADLNDGLVSYYPFDGSAVDNSSQGANHGTVNGATLTTDRFGNTQSAYTFDGVDDYIQFDTEVQNAKPPYSLSLWLKYDAVPEENSYIISNGGQTGGSQGFSLLITGVSQEYCGKTHPQGAITFGIGNQEDNIRAIITAPLLPEGWHYVTALWDAVENDPKLYIDGELSNIDKCQFDLGFGTQNDMRIGTPSNVLNSTLYLNGEVDSIRIYNRALSEPEIQELYNEGSAPNEEPETPVAILSENLDIHIPVLHYQVNESVSANLDIYLSSVPSEDGSLAWKLESFSDTVCSNLVLNSCSNTYTSATAASNETNSRTPFNIHIPAINYLENNYWANLKFAGTQNDSLTWELEDYGASEELFGKEQIARAITRALSKVGQDLAVSELIDSNLAKYSADIIAHVLSYQTLFPITVEDISKIITPLKKKGDLFNQGSKKDYLFLVTDILIEGVKSYVEFKYKDDIGAQKGFVWMTDIAYNNIKAAITGNVLDGVISNGKVLYDIGKENYNAYGEYVEITWDVKYSQTFGNIATLADTYQQYYSKSPSSKQHFLDEFESKCLEHKENEGIVFSSDYLLAFNSKISLLCIDYQIKFRGFDENKEGGINYFTSINDESGFMTFLERYIHPDERGLYIQAFEERNDVE